jgi:hypothetical protein
VIPAVMSPLMLLKCIFSVRFTILIS